MHERGHCMSRWEIEISQISDPSSADGCSYWARSSTNEKENSHSLLNIIAPLLLKRDIFY